jgi:hypothetical protein
MAAVVVAANLNHAKKGVKRTNSRHSSIRALQKAIDAEDQTQTQLRAENLTGLAAIHTVGCQTVTRHHTASS